MRKLLLSFLFALIQVVLFAQSKEITGTVRDSRTHEPLPGVMVKVEGVTGGVATDVQGEFKINVDGEGKQLEISFIGYKTQKVAADKSNIDVDLEEEAQMLSETVVTALGVSREKKSLGYATQEISGDKLTEVKSNNFVSQMSGKVAGLRVKNTGNIGGSVNIMLRGATSIFGSNQPLFIIDGVPMDNSSKNSDNTTLNLAGYDYGSPISDINPEDIESLNVLKGGAATALYGSRASNGVILITTKKGKLATGDVKKRFGVTLNSNITIGIIDKSTFPVYQQEYGAGYSKGYGPNADDWFDEFIIDGKTFKGTPLTEDASYGAKFDPNLMIMQWNSLYPGSPTYHQATPWVSAGDNGPIKFFNKQISTTNGFALDGGNEMGSFRLSYTNSMESGIMPNSSIKKNNFGFGGGIHINDRLSSSVNANFVSESGVGRNETGYNYNMLTSMRQWLQTNVKYSDLKSAYEKTKMNYGWNPGSYRTPGVPIYWNNPYFQREKSYNSDNRNRFFGNAGLTYKVNDWINAMVRVGVDQYATLREERLAIGSLAQRFGISGKDQGSGYDRINLNFLETNLDGMINFKKDFGENLNLSGLIGTNIRRTQFTSIESSTNGGLVVPDLYSVTNSVDPVLPPVEGYSLIGVNGYFASASLGYKRFLYLDVSARQDYSSTLPVGHNKYFYPGVSASFIFSEKMKNLPWLSFGKVRLNYAQVGKDAQFAQIKDVYTKPDAFGSLSMFRLPTTKNNDQLRPEKSIVQEVGLEMNFLKNRVGFDFALYNSNTIDQVLPVQISTATGYSYKYVNAGKVNNKGLELALHGSPVKTANFEWRIDVNYASYRNKVVSLFTDASKKPTTNAVIYSYPFSVTYNATVGEPLGTLKGTDYVYLDGKRVVRSNGRYQVSSETDRTIGNVNPDFTGGISNTFTYKNWTASFLVDMQKGGDIFSLDMYYGLATGLYPETVGNNDLGNPKRNDLSQGGGIILDGVLADGSPNTRRVAADFQTYGYSRNPQKKFIYDASYVKLREASISYRVPLKREYFFTEAAIGLVGSNLWIIHKNLPYADPEAGASSGNAGGYQAGVMPSLRTFGFNLTLRF